ncbi:exonuclease V subunit gamma [Candidatus Magnetomorum sp. HK-1]|nr:exonuclease V subunit gamma [Candidatus Magnetomorum sp. HK-1]
MSTVTIYQSNKTEKLLDKLAEILRTPLSNPLAPETIIVQSKGMERWISLQLAERMECCANIEFPFPNGFVRSLFAELMPDIDQSFNKDKPQEFDVDVMTWKLMQCISKHLENDAFAPLANYLIDDVILDLKKLQLCERIADTFDQYVIFRPEMIDSWEKKQDNHWQAILWRALSENVSDLHDARLGQMAMKRLFDNNNNSKPFKERFFVFGISAIPKFHTQLLIALSHICDVHIFLLNPSQEYWGEIRSKKEIARIHFKTSPDLEEDLFLEEGHPLLASMGKLGRDFFNMLYGFMDNHYIQMDFKDCFEPVSAKNLLTSVQAQMLELNSEMEKSTIHVAPEDHSIAVHSCHSPMREVEVLYDQLLHMFENDPSLSPRDVLVMTPDIETYAPLIQAVFDHPDRHTAIPYSITDRNRRKESQIIDAFLMILDLPGSRLEAGQMLSILECPAVARRFNIASTDMPLINHWVEETRIRWGESGEYRTQFGMGAYPENTWRYALDRLLLGYAMPGEKDHPFCSILPYDAIEGQTAALVGHFVQWAETIFKTVKALDSTKTIIEWVQIFNTVLDDCFLPQDVEDIQIIAIRDILHRLEQISNKLGQENNTFNLNNMSISFSAIKWYLSHTLEKPRSHMGFLSGHVTCCAMLPMRAIPFKVICMIGLNDLTYPRRDRSPNFDLIAQNPKAGDRSIRNDDRYIFLEALISARKRLYISYVGQSITDNALRPPSVLISELLDYLDDHFVFSNGNSRESLITYHRLQAFHQAYFNDKNILFSYSSDNCNAAKELIARTKQTEVPFLSKPFPEVVENKISLTELLTFFRNPIQYFFNHRLGLVLTDRVRTLERREPFNIEGLEKYNLKNDLLDILLENDAPYAFLDQIRAKGILPLGEVGRVAYIDVIDELKQMSKKIQHLIKDPLPDITLDIKIDGIQLFGNIQNCYQEGLVFYRPTKAKPKDFIDCWLIHLALNIQEGSNRPPSWFVGNDNAYQFPSIVNSKALLSELISIFQQGLNEPIHFFPETSYVFIETLLKGKTEVQSIEKAAQIWLPNKYRNYPSESENLYYDRYFQNHIPLDNSFISLAKTILKPLQQNLKKYKSLQQDDNKDSENRLVNKK